MQISRSILYAILAGIFSIYPTKIYALEINREYGEASFKFLKLPLSPRIVGLGGAGAALSDGAGELDLNPAAAAPTAAPTSAAASPAGNNSGHIIASQGYPFSEFGAATNFITWSIPLEKYSLLLNARYLGFDKIEGHNDNSQATTAYGAHSFKAQAGVAGMLLDISWGLTVNFATNNIANANYSSALINAGLRYQIISGLYAGLSAVNADFWTSTALVAGNADPFPPTALQAGLSYAHAIGSQFKAALALDARTRNDEKMAWPMGAEITYADLITGRIGYPLLEQEPGIAAGVGIHWSRFQLQYAYQGHETLSAGHFFSLDVAY